MLNNGDAWKPKVQQKMDLKRDLFPLISDYASLAGFSFLGIINVQQSINYLKTALITNIATNISMHFVTMLLKFINLRVGTKELRKTRASDKLAAVKALKNALLNNEETGHFEQEFQQLLDDIRKLDLPVATRPIPLDAAVSPCSYLRSYFKLAALFQEYGFKLFSPIPLRTAFIPSHVAI